MIFLPMEDAEQTREVVKQRYYQEKGQEQDAYLRDLERLQLEYEQDLCTLWERHREELEREGL